MERGRIPNKLKFYRHCKAFPQKKVARMLGLPDAKTLSRWECGGSMPSLKHLFLLAHIFDVLPHQLYENLWNEAAVEVYLLIQHNESITSTK